MTNAGIWEQNTPYSKLMITVGAVLVFAITLGTIATVVSPLFFNVSLDELKTLNPTSANPDYLSALKLIQTLSSIGTFVIPPLVLAFLFSQRPSEYLSLNKGISAADVLLVLTAMFASVPLINYLVELNGKMSLPSFLDWLEEWMQKNETLAAEVTEKFLDVNSVSQLLLNVFIVALIPAIGEELLFRGVVQKIFTELFKSPGAAILVTSILFSALHFQFYGFLPRMLLGILLGYMLVWSGSLWLPMVAHFINNAAGVILVYLYHTGSINIDPDKVGAENDSFSALVTGTLFLIAALWLLYKKHKQVRTE